MNNGTSNVPWTLGSGSCRALWNTYGEIPSGSKGLYLSVEESHPFEVWQSRNAHTRATPAGTLADGSDYGTGSLASVCGFKTSKEKVGQIASAREISELVVAVPYLHTATKEQKTRNKSIGVRISEDISSGSTDLA